MLKVTPDIINSDAADFVNKTSELCLIPPEDATFITNTSANASGQVRVSWIIGDNKAQLHLACGLTNGSANGPMDVSLLRLHQRHQKVNAMLNADPVAEVLPAIRQLNLVGGGWPLCAVRLRCQLGSALQEV